MFLFSSEGDSATHQWRVEIDGMKLLGEIWPPFEEQTTSYLIVFQHGCFQK